MAIFARRDIQRMLLENSRILTPDQTGKLVGLLNADRSLGTEWEVVLVNALSQLGKVTFEGKLREKTPDILFEPVGSPDGAFLAEITAPSEKGARDANPVDSFIEEFWEAAKGQGVRADAFAIELSGCSDDQKRRGRVVALPCKGEIHGFVKRQMGPFLKQVSSHPERPCELPVSENDVRLKVTYNPTQRSFSLSYPKFTVPRSYEKNTVYNALKSKADQLARTSYLGVRGVFLCDGGLNLSDRGRRGIELGNLDVIEAFLRKRRSISFVCCIEVRTRPHSTRPPWRWEVKAWVVANQHADHPLPLPVRRVLESLPSHIPPPVTHAADAVALLTAPKRNRGLSFYGRWEMRKEIKIPARALLELLAGKLDQKEFLDKHRLPDAGKTLFEIKLQQGKLISGVALERSEHADDDWVVFRFADQPDAAISPFTAAERKPT